MVLKYNQYQRLFYKNKEIEKTKENFKKLKILKNSNKIKKYKIIFDITHIIYEKKYFIQNIMNISKEFVKNKIKSYYS